MECSSVKKHCYIRSLLTTHCPLNVLLQVAFNRGARFPSVTHLHAKRVNYSTHQPTGVKETPPCHLLGSFDSTATFTLKHPLIKNLSMERQTRRDKIHLHSLKPKTNCTRFWRPVKREHGTAIPCPQNPAGRLLKHSP